MNSRHDLLDLFASHIVGRLLQEGAELLRCLPPSFQTHQYVPSHQVDVGKIPLQQIQLSQSRHELALPIQGFDPFELGLPAYTATAGGV